MPLSLSHSGGRKQVVDELQYDGIDRSPKLPQYRAEEVLSLIVQNLFLASALNAILVYASAAILPFPKKVKAIRIIGSYIVMIIF